MFQSLSQGATVSLLYRNVPKVVDARVVAVNTHLPQYNPQQPLAMMNGPVTDITVQVGNETIPFVSLPSSGVVANFPDKGYFLAIDRSSIYRELEAMVAASKQVLESVPAHEKIVSDCESLLLELNPEKKKEVQQTQEMNELRDKIDRIEKLILDSLGTKKEK
jgi:hypothetical protein